MYEVPADLVLPIARLIAGRDDEVRYHSGGNEYRHTGPWPKQAPDQPWAIHLQDRRGQYRTLAFDLDASRGDASSDARVLAEICEDARLAHLIVKSGPSGGYHILVPCDPTVRLAVAAQIGRAAQNILGALDVAPLTSGDHSAIRPPGSPHRLGAFSSLLVSAPDCALATLRQANDGAGIARFLQRLGLGHISPSGAWLQPSRLDEYLSPDCQRMLRDGVKRKGDCSRSGVLWSLIVSALVHGAPIDTFWHAVQDRRHLGGERVWRMVERSSAGAARRHLEGEWVRAQDWVAKNPRSVGHVEGRDHLREISVAATQWAWTGRNRSIDRVVLEALVGKGLELGRVSFAVSQRELAVLAKVNRYQTVGKALRRLEQVGWFVRIRACDAGHSDTFRMQVPVEGGTSTRSDGDTRMGEQVRHTLSSDVFRWGGLSRSCLLVFSALASAGPLTTPEVVTLSGCSRATVYRALKRLEELQMVSRLDGGQWLTTPRDPRVLEIELGTAGETLRQVERHTDEREWYRREHGYVQTTLDPTTGELKKLYVLGTGSTGLRL